MTKTNKDRESGVKARVLQLQTADGELRVTVPPDARLTFGPNVPYTRNANRFESRQEGYALRVYATKANDSLIAVFANVGSFRDITIPVQKLVIRESGKSLWKSDEDGYKVETEVKKNKTLVDASHLLNEGNEGF